MKFLHPDLTETMTRTLNSETKYQANKMLGFNKVPKANEAGCQMQPKEFYIHTLLILFYPSDDLIDLGKRIVSGF